jgi:hypothetical protein
LRLRKHSCPIRTGDILFDVAVNPGAGTLYAVVRDPRFSGFRYHTIALTQSTDGGQSVIGQRNACKRTISDEVTAGSGSSNCAGLPGD